MIFFTINKCGPLALHLFVKRQKLNDFILFENTDLSVVLGLKICLRFITSWVRLPDQRKTLMFAALCCCRHLFGVNMICHQMVLFLLIMLFTHIKVCNQVSMYQNRPIYVVFVNLKTFFFKS